MEDYIRLLAQKQSLSGGAILITMFIIWLSLFSLCDWSIWVHNLLYGPKQGGLATAFDLAAFRLSMIAPVKKSVNHSRTVASMRETG